MAPHVELSRYAELGQWFHTHSVVGMGDIYLDSPTTISKLMKRRLCYRRDHGFLPARQESWDDLFGISLAGAEGKFCCGLRMVAAPWMPVPNTVLTSKASP